MTAVRPADGYKAIFETAFTRSANPMLLVDIRRRIVAANQATAVAAGRSVGWLTGRRTMDLLDDPHDALDDEAWLARVREGETLGRRRIRRPDGSVRVVDFAMRPTRVDGRVLVLAVCLHERAGRRDGDERDHRPAALTARERDIIHRIALGEVSPEICAELHIAPDTVRTHVRNAMRKTGARTRAQLIAIALTDGLLEP